MTLKCVHFVGIISNGYKNLCGWSFSRTSKARGFTTLTHQVLCRTQFQKLRIITKER